MRACKLAIRPVLPLAVLQAQLAGAEDVELVVVSVPLDVFVNLDDFVLSKRAVRRNVSSAQPEHPRTHYFYGGFSGSFSV